jgi:enamine deaminase RidA (YjgF/YER057c/UK114 family)
MTVEEKLTEMGLTLPPPADPVGAYIGAVQVGNLLFVSGHGPRRYGDVITNGKVGKDLNLEQAYETARSVMLNVLGTVKSTIGDLDRVERIVKLLGMVNCAPGFNQTPAVINGASDLLIALYGENGRHARSAVGMAELPNDIAVEIEMIVRIKV